METETSTIETTQDQITMEQEPVLLYSKNGRKIICEDLNLANEIIFPINQLVYYADDIDNLDPEKCAKNFSKCQDLFDEDFGSDIRKELMFDQHGGIENVNVQRIFLLNEFALVIAKVTTHREEELVKSYKLVKVGNEYKFFKFPADSALPPASLKGLYIREKIEFLSESVQ